MFSFSKETTHIKGPGHEILVLAGTHKVDAESIAHLQVWLPRSGCIGKQGFPGFSLGRQIVNGMGG